MACRALSGAEARAGDRRGAAATGASCSTTAIIIICWRCAAAATSMSSRARTRSGPGATTGWRIWRHMLGLEEAEGWRDKSARIRQAIREELWDAKRGGSAACIRAGMRKSFIRSRPTTRCGWGLHAGDGGGAAVPFARRGVSRGMRRVQHIRRGRAPLRGERSRLVGRRKFRRGRPILAQTLWEIGRPELAWDVLKRHLWIGTRLPYVPQEHYCDRPMAPAHKRANNISGMAGAQAVIFGMAGIRPQLDGRLLIHPQPPEEGRVSIIGYAFRGIATTCTWSRELPDRPRRQRNLPRRSGASEDRVRSGRQRR